MSTKVLSKNDADKLLATLDLKIGNWNEVTSTKPSNAQGRMSFRPSTHGAELYEQSRQLLAWVSRGGWTLFQVDNSTAPTEPEISLFEKLALQPGEHWDVGEQKTFVFDGAETSPDSDRTSLVLLVFFSILFEWHVHLTSQEAHRRQHLSLQDGMAYFFGDVKTIDEAAVLVNGFDV